VLGIRLGQEKIVLKKIEFASKHEPLKLVFDLAQVKDNGGTNHTRVLAGSARRGQADEHTAYHGGPTPPFCIKGRHVI
jgi:hypothetical protein